MKKRELRRVVKTLGRVVKRQEELLAEFAETASEQDEQLAAFKLCAADAKRVLEARAETIIRLETALAEARDGEEAARRGRRDAVKTIEALRREVACLRSGKAPPTDADRPIEAGDWVRVTKPVGNLDAWVSSMDYLNGSVRKVRSIDGERAWLDGEPFIFRPSWLTRVPAPTEPAK